MAVQGPGESFGEVCDNATETTITQDILCCLLLAGISLWNSENIDNSSSHQLQAGYARES